MKASTSDAAEDATMSPSAPDILVQNSPVPDEAGEYHPRGASDSGEQRHSEASRGCVRNVGDVDRLDEHGDHEVHDGSNRPEGELRSQAFFVGEEDLQLAGVGVFSPAASQPSSPELPRMKLNTLEGGIVKVTEGQPGSSIRRRPREQEGSGGN